MSNPVLANLPASSQVAGDKQPQHVLIVNSSGTAIETFGGSGGTATADGSAFVADTTQGTPMMAVYESSPTAMTSGDVGIPGMTANRELKVSVTSGGTAGTQYTEGDTDTTITGTAVMFETNTGTSTLGVVSSAAPLPVTLANTGANATAVKVDGSAVTQPVSGTVTANAGSGTFAVSAVSLPLPTGAATAAKQPALGVAGTASTDVITIQGIASMTAVKVDGSGVTQPVSGTVTVTDGSGSLTVDGTVAATQSGTWSVRAQDGSGNALTSKVAGAERALSIAIVDGSGNQITSFGGGTQYTEGDTDTTITGTAVMFESNTGTSAVSVVSASAPLPVTLANTGANTTAVKVDGSAVTQPVSDASGSLTVDAPVGTPVFVRLSDGASAISTLPVSLASVPSHAVTNAGTFAVQESGAALTALQLIDDGVATVASAIPAKGMAAVGTDGTNARILKTDTSGELQVDVLTMPTVTVTGTVAATQSGTWNVGTVTPGTAAANLGKAEDDAHTSGDVGVMALAVRKDTAAAVAGTDGDYTPLQATATGNLRVCIAEEEVLQTKYAAIAASSSGNNTLVAAVTSKKIRVHSLYLVAAAAVTAKFQSGASGTDLSGAMAFAANGGMSLGYNPYGWFETASNTLLNLNLGGAVSVAGGLTYTEV